MDYFIADTHFNHLNIITYCQRPFHNVNEMTEYMIDSWNSVVTKKDNVFFLGDFGFGTVEMMTKIVSKLNGYKIIILGNHDWKRGINSWKGIGFNEVYKKPIEYKSDLIIKSSFNKIILSHQPKECEDTTLNIHGHIHDVPLQGFSKKNHICVSVEMINYIPITLEEIFKRIEKQLDKA